MNIASVIRTALLEANVVRQNATTPALLVLADLVTWANDCQRKLEALWRRSGQDWNLVTRESDDGSFTYDDETYANSSYQMLTTTRAYTLPPDLITLKRIRSISTSYREYVFTPMDVNHPVFRDLENADNPGGSEIYWDVVGRRTLRLSHPMPATSEIEIMYNARLPRLYVYDPTLTANLTIDSASVTIATGTMLVDRLSTPAELILNTSLGNGNPKIVSTTSTDNFVQPALTTTVPGFKPLPIESFDSATVLTLEATWPHATDTSVGFIIASAPSYLEDHWPLMVEYLKYKIKERLGMEKGAEQALGSFMAGSKQFEYDIHKRADEAVFVEDFVG